MKNFHGKILRPRYTWSKTSEEFLSKTSDLLVQKENDVRMYLEHKLGRSPSREEILSSFEYQNYDYFKGNELELKRRR